MANYRAVANGNWSALATWQDDSSGSYVASTVLPGVADVVYANNFTVTLDIDVVVQELRTTTSTNVNNGGLFNFGAANSVTANIFSGNSTCVRNNTSNTKNITGNVVAGNQLLGAVQNQTNGTINLYGNGVAGNGGRSYAVSNRSTGTINVYGNIAGGSVNTAAGAENVGGFLNIFGIASAGNSSGNINPNTGASAIMHDGVCTTYVSLLLGSTTSPGVTVVNQGTASGKVIVNSIEYASNGFPISVVPLVFATTGSLSSTVTLENNTTATLVDPSSGFPSTTDVRDGVSYASGALTGTLIVPNPANVASGVPTDNTVGTAALTPADFWDYLTSSATPGSMGARVAAIPTNPASVESTGAQIASFNT
jgi:hypothetical protein